MPPPSPPGKHVQGRTRSPLCFAVSSLPVRVMAGTALRSWAQPDVQTASFSRPTQSSPLLLANLINLIKAFKDWRLGHQITINTFIVEAETWQRVLQLVTELLVWMDDINVATALHRLASRTRFNPRAMQMVKVTCPAPSSRP